MKMSPIQASFLGVFLCLVALSIKSAEADKAGVCPPERKYIKTNENPPPACKTDSDCLGVKKCCTDNGQKFCKMPAGDRPGTCRKIKDEPEPNGPCNDACTSDNECAPKTNCCETKCRNRCLPDLGVKPGACSQEVLQCFLGQRNTCGNDTDCPNEEKCCPASCGNTCQPPVKK